MQRACFLSLTAQANAEHVFVYTKLKENAKPILYRPVKLKDGFHR